jgi:signal transduction histidine kinase
MAATASYRPAYHRPVDQLTWRPTPRQTDVLLMAAVSGVLVLAVASDQAAEPDASGPLAYVWALGLGLLMLIRRSLPAVVLLLTTLGYFTYYMAGFPAIGVAVPIAAAVYSAAEAGRMVLAGLASAVVLGGSTAFRLASGQPAAFVVGYELVGHAALLVAVIALGYSIRARRAIQMRIDQVTRLASHQARVSSEDRLRDDRVRLSRELHDSLGHSLTVAALYVNVAAEAADQDEQRAAMARVRGALSDSIANLRSTVTLLRSPTTDDDQPQLGDIAGLVAPLATAGYDVQVAIDQQISLDQSIVSTAFRVVQEAVTNILRHSDASTIEVTLEPVEPATIRVTVADNGSRRRPPRFVPGHGLDGMRERVEAVGGHLRVDTTSQGWRIDASLPRQVPP